jgi:hypothetical protein
MADLKLSQFTIQIIARQCWRLAGHQDDPAVLVGFDAHNLNAGRDYSLDHRGHVSLPEPAITARHLEFMPSLREALRPHCADTRPKPLWDFHEPRADQFEGIHAFVTAIHSVAYVKSL